MDDAIREMAWENGFRIPLAPIKGKEKLYLIGSQKMLVELIDGTPYV